MTWPQIVLLGILGAFVVALIRASIVLGKNPYQRIEEAEKLAGGKLPQDMTFEQKQQMLDTFGISRRSTKQSLTYVGIALVGALFVYLLIHWNGTTAP